MRRMLFLVAVWMVVAPHAPDAAAAEAVPLTAERIAIAQDRLTIPAGTVLVDGRPVRIATEQTFTIRPADVATVENEPLKLSKEKPAGFFRGTPLKGPWTKQINAFNAFIEDSLVLSRTPGGAPLVKDADYLVSAPFALLGLGTSTTLTADDTVYATYRYHLRRIDAVFVDAAGIMTLVEGRPHVSCPHPPEPPAPGSTRLLNIYRPYGAVVLESAHLFPVLEGAERTPAHTTPGRIPRTLAKLRAGQPVRIVCWGDSITAGGDASSPERSYVGRFTDELQARFPDAPIEVINLSLGGSKSVQWLNRGNYPGLPLYPADTCDFERVIEARPDLVTSEFVNDMVLDPAVYPEAYTTIKDKLAAIGAEWIIITPSFGEPGLMKFTSLTNPDNRPLTAFLCEFADRHNIAVADASARWAHLWKEGIPYETYLFNAYNHPDDRGHQMFAEELMKCFQ